MLSSFRLSTPSATTQYTLIATGVATLGVALPMSYLFCHYLSYSTQTTQRALTALTITGASCLALGSLAKVHNVWVNLPISGGIKDKGVYAAYQTASLCTDPPCKAREHLWLAKTANSTLSTTWHWGACIAYGALAIPLAPLGMLLRYGAQLIESHLYTFYGSPIEEKVLQEPTASLFHWNICGVPAGYCISDGGVSPLACRLHRIIEVILKKDADIVSLNEVFDIQDAARLCQRLDRRYKYFYYNLGAHAVGPSSALFIASKVALHHPTFTPFTQDELDGRAQSSAKGFFSCSIQSKGGRSTRLVFSHMQHSELPEFATEGEKQARQKEKQAICNHQQGDSFFLIGDLNLDFEEFEGSWNEGTFSLPEGDPGKDLDTWGGDAWCARSQGKLPSNKRRLDYVLYSGQGLSSKLLEHVKTGFTPHVYAPRSLSDHDGLVVQLSWQD